MKGQRGEKSKGYELMTVERLREFPGIENLSDKEAKQVIIAGEKGKLIERAFEMKVEGLTNIEIAVKLDKLGLRLDKKRLSEVFRNPFYCGYIAHGLLDDQIITGKHEPLISPRNCF